MQDKRKQLKFIFTYLILLVTATLGLAIGAHFSSPENAEIMRGMIFPRSLEDWWNAIRAGIALAIIAYFIVIAKDD